MSPALIVWTRILELHAIAEAYEQQTHLIEATEAYLAAVDEMVAHLSILRRSGVFDRLTAFLDTEGLR